MQWNSGRGQFGRLHSRQAKLACRWNAGHCYVNRYFTMAYVNRYPYGHKAGTDFATRRFNHLHVVRAFVLRFALRRPEITPQSPIHTKQESEQAVHGEPQNSRPPIASRNEFQRLPCAPLRDARWQDTIRRNPWLLVKRSSASTWARPTRSSPSWKAKRRRSFRTPKATGSRPASSHSPTRAKCSSASRPVGRPSPTRRARSTRSSASWAAGTAKWQTEEKMVPYEVVGGPEDYVKVRGRRQGIHAAGNLRQDPAQAQGSGGGLSGPQGEQGRHHGAGLLQRRPAAGHQGRRPDRRPGSRPHHQRADGRVAGLRPRQEGRRNDLRVRPRRRHVRRVGARSGRRRVPRHLHQRRHAPRRRRLRRSAHQLRRRAVPARAGHRPAQGPHGPAAAAGSVRKGQEGAQLGADHRHQPAVHHGRRERPEALADDDHAGRVREAGRPSDRPRAAAR